MLDILYYILLCIGFICIIILYSIAALAHAYEIEVSNKINIIGTIFIFIAILCVFFCCLIKLATVPL